MPFTAVIDAGQFTLNGRSFRDAAPLGRFHDVLGCPDRIEAVGQSAPVGHRNNQIHFYDELGLYLNEHHYTYSITAVTFVLWREEAAFRLRNEINGQLRLGGIEMNPGITELDLQDTKIPFVSELRGTWHFESDELWIGFDSKGEKGPTGRRSKRRRIVSVSVCLKHDPWDTRFRNASDRELTR